MRRSGVIYLLVPLFLTSNKWKYAVGRLDRHGKLPCNDQPTNSAVILIYLSNTRLENKETPPLGLTVYFLSHVY